jgi:hypothetical protein
MNKAELIQKCKKLGITGLSSKTKTELLQIIMEKEQQPEKQSINVITDESTEATELFRNVLCQLLSHIPKDKLRKVCKNCHELGHGSSSIICKINIDKNAKLKRKIKAYILSQNCLQEKTMDDICNELSVMLEITPNHCRTLYDELPPMDLLDRPFDIDQYLIQLDQSAIKCNECNKSLVYIQANTHHRWKDTDICDTCWSKYSEIRNKMWETIKLYKRVQCELCGSIQHHSDERYHYDHLNMFNKDNSICCMINEGSNIEEIYAEIDKCQILCLSCHHQITDIERKIGFTRIKQTLSRRFTLLEITEEEYNREIIMLQEIYNEKMSKIYEKMRNK